MPIRETYLARYMHTSKREVKRRPKKENNKRDLQTRPYKDAYSRGILGEVHVHFKKRSETETLKRDK